MNQLFIFYGCLIVKRIWNQLKSILLNNLTFSISMPQRIIFGFWDLHTDERLILNNLLLVFTERYFLKDSSLFLLCFQGLVKILKRKKIY